ncbi:MAG: glycogen/starch/alpha-glucan phosphorylase [Holophagaceae bacterium]|nr:glycogen/starch/alpha-glucan phosphorylase [Holophagaceae bacterium]
MDGPPLLSTRVGFDDAVIPVDADSLRRDFIEKLFYQQAKFPAVATLNDHYLALAYVVRDRLLSRWTRTARTYFEEGSRTVAYLSAEFLLGPQLGNNVLCLRIEDAVREALKPLNLSLDALLAHEEEPGLGNGGLGRLAACYMDSLATLSIPAIGYGIRYEYGIFDQKIQNGQQIELADKWLRYGNPWEIPRPQILHPVGFGGATHHYTDEHGRFRVKWTPARMVNGIPYDTPVLGYGTETANFLRLWHAVASEAFDFQAFNAGDYYRAVEDKVRSETISKVLYPNDVALSGRQLRLEQQYLLVACSLRDMIRIHLQRAPSIHHLHEKYAIQLNDTHPALAVLELMRILVDEYDLGWEEAWAITVKSFGYTNHTLLPEALETWGLPLFGSLLPRHLEIVFEINQRFLSVVRSKYPGDETRVGRMSLVDERGERYVRMAHVACVGCHTINGVADMHSRLLKETVLKDFAEMYPARFSNVTNGITPRRFLALANPGLAGLITDAIGDGWQVNLDHLSKLEPLANDAAFRAAFRRVKHENKRLLAEHVNLATGLDLDPKTLLSVQVKRIHEYKRQVLNLLHVVTSCLRIQAGVLPETRRTFLFAGKAAPGYFMAKLVIRLIHDVADWARLDPDVRQWISVLFVPDFNVKIAERIYPAADLSVQISTAGKEASGTGNMKQSLNGALTIGTLDGANVEIREHVGADNFYLFGLRADEVRERKAAGYRPWELAESDAELRAALDLIGSGQLSGGDRERYAPLIRSLLEHDEYMVLSDYRAYVEAEERVSIAYCDTEAWTRRAVQTVARMGYFSSDRSIRDYCREIWKVEPVNIPAR